MSQDLNTTPALASVLSRDQRAAFERDGVIRFVGLLPADRVRETREAVLQRLEHAGLWRDGAWQLEERTTAVKTSKAIGNRLPQLAELLASPQLSCVVRELLGGEPAEGAIWRRPQVLFTLPNAKWWALPLGWHIDAPRLASDKSAGVQVFAFLDHVAPRAGGTLVVSGSHRLVNEGRSMRASELTRGSAKSHSSATSSIRRGSCSTPARPCQAGPPRESRCRSSSLLARLVTPG